MITNDQRELLSFGSSMRCYLSLENIEFLKGRVPRLSRSED